MKASVFVGTSLDGFIARANRFVAGRDPIGYFFHEQLKSLVSDIAGQPVKASFSFFTS